MADLIIYSLYHGVMKADLQISVKDHRRNKNLKIQLQRVPLGSVTAVLGAAEPENRSKNHESHEIHERNRSGQDPVAELHSSSFHKPWLACLFVCFVCFVVPLFRGSA